MWLPVVLYVGYVTVASTGTGSLLLLTLVIIGTCVHE
jgi:hypothetical protein